MDMDKFAELVRKSRVRLNVRLPDGRVLSFSTAASRDEFMARAERLGWHVIVDGNGAGNEGR